MGAHCTRYIRLKRYSICYLSCLLTYLLTYLSVKDSVWCELANTDYDFIHSFSGFRHSHIHVDVYTMNSVHLYCMSVFIVRPLFYGLCRLFARRRATTNCVQSIEPLSVGRTARPLNTANDLPPPVNNQDDCRLERRLRPNLGRNEQVDWSSTSRQPNFTHDGLAFLAKRSSCHLCDGEFSV